MPNAQPLPMPGVFKYFWFFSAVFMALNLFLWRRHLLVAVDRGMATRAEVDSFVRWTGLWLVGGPLALAISQIAAGWTSPFCAFTAPTSGVAHDGTVACSIRVPDLARDRTMTVVRFARYSRSSWRLLTVTMLVSTMWACMRGSNATRIDVGSPPSRAEITYPPLDSLLPPGERTDSAAVIARVFESGTNRPIHASLCVVPAAEKDSGDPFGTTACAFMKPGQMYLKRLAPGDYRISALLIGYRRAGRLVRLRAGQVDTLSIFLQPLPPHVYVDPAG